ncbi:shikimate kinase [Acidicapsa acidisoli]|uniref:shikimate kinase n=1 Tax=Acidicapsa acidisoli TaxID=1615681 RepID=UPI0021E0D3C9|nr:shikimate kinase [Acidicapsa acidisoli]
MPSGNSDRVPIELAVEAPAGVRRIVLTGFMGAGKTTVGRLLARRLSWQFLDVDAEIEATTGTTIAQIFQNRGEPWFRQFEQETIRRLLASESLVLALGGGAIEDSHTRNLLLTGDGTRLVHLEATLETVLTRCRGTEPLRPVLQDRDNLEDRYRRRLPLYRASHLTVAVDSLPPGAIVETILESIGSNQSIGQPIVGQIKELQR